TMMVAEVAKIDIVFFNQEKVAGEDYHAIAYQITVISVGEQTMKVAKTEVVISHQEEDVDEASQTKESKEEVKQIKEEVVEGNNDDNRNL
ncbi:hypothetical protein GIB67_039695, partial [Kingdonia uniflora]